MKREQIINILNKHFNPLKKFDGDFIGLQVEGSEEIESVIVTLDLTLEIIEQAISNKTNMIICHHPFIFGNKDEVMKLNLILKSKYDLLLKNNINVFVIHSNADFGLNGIAKKQAELLKMDKVELTLDGEAIIGENNINFNNTLELIHFIKGQLEIDYQIRTNIINQANFKKFIIASGASGDILFDQKILGNLVIVGEMKWHHWVFANEMSINVIEIGHYSENIFKKIISELFEEHEDLQQIKIIESVEENGYSSI